MLYLENRGFNLATTKPPLLRGFSAGIDDWGSLLNDRYDSVQKDFVPFGEQIHEKHHNVGRLVSMFGEEASTPQQLEHSDIKLPNLLGPFSLTSQYGSMEANVENGGMSHESDLTRSVFKSVDLKSEICEIDGVNLLELKGIESDQEVKIESKDKKLTKTLKMSGSRNLGESSGGSDSTNSSPRSTETQKSLNLFRPRNRLVRKRTRLSNRGGSNIIEYRVSSACTNCRASKVRCDHQRPCVRCIRQGRPHTCMDSDTARRMKKRRISKSLSDTDATYSFAHQLVYSFDKFERCSEEEFLDLFDKNPESPKLKPASVVDKNGKRVKALADRHSRYQGKPCYRNKWCIRQFKHCGHCKAA